MQLESGRTGDSVNDNDGDEWPVVEEQSACDGREGQDMHLISSCNADSRSLSLSLSAPRIDLSFCLLYLTMNVNDCVCESEKGHE